MISAAGSLTGENDDKLISAEILTESLKFCREKPGGLHQVCRDKIKSGSHPFQFPIFHNSIRGLV
jgi:hypothetical protein